MSNVPNLRQNHYRFRTDSLTVDTASPTWGAAEDTNYYPGLDTNFRIRFAIDNTGTGGPTNSSPQLRYSLNGAAYVSVTTASTVIRSADASTDADETSIATANFRLTAGAGTATLGKYDETGVLAVKIPNSGLYTEVEFGIVLRSADVAAGDTIDLRCYDGTTAYPTYNVTPRITVPGGATWGFETPRPQPPDPSQRWQKQAATFGGHAGTDRPLSGWQNAGWEIQPFQPPHQAPERKYDAISGFSQFAAFDLYPFNWDIQSAYQPPRRKHERAAALFGGSQVIVPPAAPSLKTSDYAWFQTPFLFPRKHFSKNDASMRHTFDVEAKFQNWLNLGFEIQSVQPPQTKQERSAAIAPKDDGVTGRYQFWINDGWEANYQQPPHPRPERWAAIAPYETSVDEVRYSQWINDGWQVASPQPPHPRPERAGAIVPKDEGIGDSFRFFFAHFDVSPVTYRSTQQRRGWALYKFDDLFIQQTATLQTADYAWFQTPPVDPRKNFARGQAIAFGHAGLDSQFVQWYNFSFENQTWHPSHPRPERWAAIAPYETSVDEVRYSQWINDGWQVASPQPPHPRPERWAAIAPYETSVDEVRYSQWINDGWQVASPQPPHPRPERWAAVTPKDDGAAGKYQFWINDGWQIAPPQPPHPRPERSGILSDGEPRIETFTSLLTAAYAWFQTPFLDPRKNFARGQVIAFGHTGVDYPLINWTSFAYENQSWHPRHPRPERAGILWDGTPRLEFQPPVGLQTGTYAWHQTPDQFPRKKFELAGSIMRGDQGSYDIYRGWFDYGFPIAPFQPPHPRPERYGAIAPKDDGAAGKYQFWINDGWQVASPQPPIRSRRERWAAIAPYETSTDENQYVRWFDYGFQIAPFQPPHPRPERWGAVAPYETSVDETRYVRWINDGWQIAPFQPPRRRHERWAGLVGGDQSLDRIVAQATFTWCLDQLLHLRSPRTKLLGALQSYPIDARYERWINSGWEIAPVQPPHRAPERASAFLPFSDSGSFDQYRRWLNYGWEIAPFQPPTRRWWLGGAIIVPTHPWDRFFLLVPPPPRVATHARHCVDGYIDPRGGTYIDARITGSLDVRSSGVTSVRPRSPTNRRTRDDGGCC